MNTRGNPALRELLAAQYALGSLRGGARRRFETWLREDAELRALVDRWQGHLAPLGELVPAIAPPARVWQGLTARLPVLGAGTAKPTGWLDSLAFWKGLAGAFAALAVLAIAVPMFSRLPGDASGPAPVTAQATVGTPPTPVAPVTQVGAAATSPAPGVSTTEPVSTYVATIEEDKTHRPVAVLVMSGAGSDVVLELVGAKAAVPKDRALQLWMANPSGPGVVSAGIAPQGAGGTPVRFAVPDAERLRTSAVIGLSLEPPGGSPSATHVLGFGKWTKVS